MLIKIKEVDKRYTDQITDLISNIQQNEFNISISIEDQPDLLAIEDYYISNGGFFFGAFIDDELVGTIALVKFDDHSGAIRKMFVKKEFRGKELNIAQKLFDVLIDQCCTNSIENVLLGTVSVLKAAQRFYERNGFGKIEKSQLPDKFPRMSADNVFYSINLN